MLQVWRNLRIHLRHGSCKSDAGVYETSARSTIHIRIVFIELGILLNMKQDLKQEVKQETKINSVYEITFRIKEIIDSDKSLQNIWVKGEISNLTLHNNGYTYFVLKDERSEIKCVIFNQEFNFKPENGIKVVVRGRIGTWKSAYQIVVEEINLEGRGELYFKFLQLKENLQKEGLFEQKYKKLIPSYPKIRVGCCIYNTFYLFVWRHGRLWLAALSPWFG